MANGVGLNIHSEVLQGGGNLEEIIPPQHTPITWYIDERKLLVHDIETHEPREHHDIPEHSAQRKSPATCEPSTSHTPMNPSELTS
jgi:hypothetical protein